MEFEREVAAAARRTGVICRLGEMAILEVRGPDAGRYLEAMCTKDLSGLDPGGLRYGALLDDRAHFVAAFWIWRVGESWWLEVESAAADSLRDRLNRFAVADDIEVMRREDLELFHVEGPRAGEVAGAVLGGDLGPDGAGAASRPNVVGWARRSRFAEEGFTFACAGGSPPGWKEAAQAASLYEAAESVQERLRIEAGRPRFGIDFGETDLLPEVGLWGAVSLDKGCFPGQEIVRRVIARGEVKRRLVGLEASSYLLKPDIPGRGRTTSVSETNRREIAIGWVEASHAKPGSLVAAEGPRRDGGEGSALSPFRVAALPFISGPHAAAPDVPGERVENTASR